MKKKLYIIFREIVMNFKGYFFSKFTSLKVYIELYGSDPVLVRARLFNKISKPLNFILLIPFFPLILPIIFLMRIVSFFYTIRIGNLESNAIGHFSLPVEIYLAELDCGIHKNTRVLDLWYLQKKVCNRALEAKWREHLFIVPRFMLQPLDLINQVIPGGQKNVIHFRRLSKSTYSSANNPYPWQSIDIHDVISKTRPRIIIAKSEKLESEKILKLAGFDPYKKYVCIHNRDSTFHSDEISNHRNSSINDFKDAVNYLVTLGYQVIRMGAKAQGKLEIESSLYFDYAQSGIRSELLDLFLISQCSFFIGNGSGIDFVPSLFRKRVVYINFSQFGTIPEVPNTSIVIFRRMKVQEKILSILEIIEKGYESYTTVSQFKKAGIELISNSNQEIRLVILEAHERLNNNWSPRIDEEKNQDLFRERFLKHPNESNIIANIGYDFLRENLDLLK